ncbi:hypothetical protein CDL15_Pgr004392 [Punica granatum]|uniref:CDP-diacylglycerol--inositol 3-phosphatidyltransferase n=1 Tax=Punica granatum TaxID=22663 RepID=A0A218XHM5_PUNGR|nr:hypothetical protein CDL15_Pgr004392 [Punica granatum]
MQKNSQLTQQNYSSPFLSPHKPSGEQSLPSALLWQPFLSSTEAQALLKIPQNLLAVESHHRLLHSPSTLVPMKSLLLLLLESALDSVPQSSILYLRLQNGEEFDTETAEIVGVPLCPEYSCFVCDAIDGWCARKFNQVSTFGAVLDMVTDRISTACLLVILSQVYSPGLIFLSLLALDISSHWLQMYSTFLLGKGSHKDVKDSTNWLFRAYYGNRKFMGYCCVACEVLYIILFLVADNETENLADVLLSLAKQSSPLTFITALSLFGWAIKQIVNVIQMKTAADVCVLYDINKKQASS